ncbi:MAG TPA: YetF domain-containing protein [Phenylobacterium sp.]
MEIFRALIGPDNGDATAAQLCARALILFVVGIVYIRIAGRRTFSHATPLDIVVAIVVGSNLSRAMTGKAPFWPSLAATLLLVVLHRVLAMATLRWTWLARLIKARPVILMRDGARDEKAMRRHAIGEVDLMESLRLEQVEKPEEVHLATLENSGKISVVRRKRGDS